MLNFDNLPCKSFMSRREPRGIWEAEAWERI